MFFIYILVLNYSVLSSCLLFLFQHNSGGSQDYIAFFCPYLFCPATLHRVRSARYSCHSNIQVHNRQVPSAPALAHHGSRGCQSRSSTPSSLLTWWPRSTLSGTIVAFSVKSPTTFPWNICKVPSSLASAKSGSPPGWYLTARIALLWQRRVL